MVHSSARLLNRKMHRSYLFSQLEVFRILRGSKNNTSPLGNIKSTKNVNTTRYLTHDTLSIFAILTRFITIMVHGYIFVA